VAFHGFIEDSERALLLLELVPSGDLETFMHARPDGTHLLAC
jgi:hypothetical protein